MYTKFPKGISSININLCRRQAPAVSSVTKTGRTHLATQRQQWQVIDTTLRGIWRKATPAHALG